MNNALFHEVQYFNTLRIGAIMLALVFVYKLVKTKPIPYFSAGLLRTLKVAAGIFAFPVLMLVETVRLETFYYPDHITYQFKSVFNTHPDKVYSDSIATVQIVKSDEHHWGTNTDENNQVYNVAGDHRLLMKLRNGKTIQLGTQQPDSLVHHLLCCYKVVQ